MKKDVKAYLNHKLKKAFEFRQQGLLSDSEFVELYLTFLNRAETCHYISQKINLPNLSLSTIFDKLYYEDCSLLDLEEMNNEAIITIEINA